MKSLPASLQALATVATLCITAAGALASERDGVSMPDQVGTGDASLVLNGIGTRTYSIFDVAVYVAGLYVSERSRNAEAILASPQPKMIHIIYLHEVGREDEAKAWRYSFKETCAAPCAVAEASRNRFVDVLPGIAKGDSQTFRFGSGELEVLGNGKSLGRFADPALSRLVLETFIGRAPPTEALKRQLLGG